MVPACAGSAKPPATPKLIKASAPRATNSRAPSAARSGPMPAKVAKSRSTSGIAAKHSVSRGSPLTTPVFIG